MLRSLELANFTAFKKLDLEFSAGLNVIVGTNGTGKTHILKAAYGVMAWHRDFMRTAKGMEKDFDFPQQLLVRHIAEVFRVSSLGNLVRLNSKGAWAYHCAFGNATYYRLSRDPSGAETNIEAERGKAMLDHNQPEVVYLPPQQLITIASELPAIYDKYTIPFDKTWRDTCVTLTGPLRKDLSDSPLIPLVRSLEQAMGGSVVTDDGGRFLLKTTDGTIEMHLVAEGFRKLAMLARLVATESIAPGSTVFWDEPEANLNPETIRLVAQVIVDFAKHGVQLVIATHSLFLLREIYILTQDPEREPVDARYIGLNRGPRGGPVAITQGSSIDDIGDLAALDEDLRQSDRYMDVEFKRGEA